MRIVSLLPSATEIICSLGLEDQLVGVTHECDYPESVLQLPKVTHTLIPHDATSAMIDQLVRERLKTERALYGLNLPLLEELRPDLIVTQALCDVCAVAESEVRSASCALPGSPKVLNLEPQTLQEVLHSLVPLAELCGCALRAEQAIAGFQHRLQQIKSKQISHRPRMLLLEWLDPPFCCGHWSPELVQIAGGEELIGQIGVPSRTLRWQEVEMANPEVIVIACCGFDLDRTKLDIQLLDAQPFWSRLKAVREKQVYVINGSAYFSRPGPRLVDSVEILAHCLHPEIHPDRHPGKIERVYT